MSIYNNETNEIYLDLNRTFSQQPQAYHQTKQINWNWDIFAW